MSDDNPEAGLTLRPKLDPNRDHLRGGTGPEGSVSLVVYGDYLCPYCRRLFVVLAELQSALGDSLSYAFRHLPNEREHPGAELLAQAAEAATQQGRFWEMHDWLYAQQSTIGVAEVMKHAQESGFDVDRFRHDLESESIRARVMKDLAEGRRNGLTVTPTLFINGERYDEAWDYHSMLEALQRPLAAKIKQTARSFANLPASGGLALLLASLLALLCANTPIAATYHALMDQGFSIGPTGREVSMTIAEWFSQGLLAAFFLLVGLEIRREATSGALRDSRAAILPVVAAVGGVLAPAAVFLAISTPAIRQGWSVPTATDVAFTIGILAVLGARIPPALRVFVAALAVVDDILSVLTLAIFYPMAFNAAWLPAVALATLLLFVLNRSRVYVTWPYAVVACGLWLALHAAGIHAALTGVALALFLPARPAPSAAPLLAQAATALAALEGAERQLGSEAARSSGSQLALVWESAGRNLSAAAARLLSPAERIERVIAPWSTYFILPLFAFSATGILLSVHLDSADDIRVLLGVILGLVIGKPIGVLLASYAAVKSGIGIFPVRTSALAFIGAACLCGVGDTVALLMADQAFPHTSYAPIAKIGVLLGSVVAAALGAALLARAPRQPRIDEP